MVGAVLKLAVAVLLTGAAIGVAITDPHPKTTEPPAMRFRNSYPLITTKHLGETRDFYVRTFGLEPVFEASWFVLLVGKNESGDPGPTIAFMTPDHPSAPPGPEVFSGLGMILTFEVADAAAAHKAVAKSGAPIVHPLTEEAWGQRRFMTRDPAGTLIDVVEQIEPKAGFWEKYPPRH
jgi:catechol 2,3-dioxygenase-like lactoylglutathione lyase family enzyme